MQDMFLIAAETPSNAQMLAMASVISLLGAVILSAAIFNWDWVFKSEMYRDWVKQFGRTTCRVVLGSLGAGIILFMAVRLWLDWK